MNIRTALLLLFAGASSFGEKVDSPGEAEEKATHILTGTVSAIYSKVTRGDAYETASYLAEIQIEGVEKGEGFQPGQVAYVRYWHHLKRLKDGPIEPGPSGHTNMPKEGEKRRICLVQRENGALDVYYLTGFKNPGEKAK